jgi:MFS transporter, DHA3 family, macrolide efflux protein
MLKNRNFMLLLASQIISSAGDTFTFLALSVKVTDMFSAAGESARAMGGILIAFALPQLVFALFAGTLVDRWDKRKVMIASDVIRGLLVPAFFLVMTPADLPLAFGIAFLISTFSIFFNPARTALLPALVDEEDLITANSWMQVGNTMARLAGPVAAGILIAAVGLDLAFRIDALSFLISGAFLFGMRGVLTQESVAPGQKSKAWNDLQEGIRFALNSRLLQGITLGLSVAMLGLGAVNVLFVPYLRFIFDAPTEALGIMESAQGIGMVAGGLLISGLGKRFLPKPLAFFSVILLGGGISIFGIAPNFTVALVTIACIGLTLPPLNASLQTMMQKGVPRTMLGRAGSVMDMSMTVANLISMGVAGMLGDFLGLRQTFVLSGFLLILGGVLMAIMLRGIRIGLSSDVQGEALIADPVN